MHTCPLRSESGIHSKDTVSKDLSQKLWGGIFRDFWSLKLYTILKKTHTHDQIKRKQNSQAAIYHIKRKFKFFWARQEIPPLSPPRQIPDSFCHVYSYFSNLQWHPGWNKLPSTPSGLLKMSPYFHHFQGTFPPLKAGVFQHLFLMQALCLLSHKHFSSHLSPSNLPFLTLFP